jgi:hypothetical protein
MRCMDGFPLKVNFKWCRELGNECLEGFMVANALSDLVREEYLLETQ